MSFGQCSLSSAGSLNLLLLSSKWLLATLPHHTQCTNLHQSAYLAQNLYRAGYPDHHRKIPHRQELYAITYIWPANWRFQKVKLRKCQPLWWVACRAEVESALEAALCGGWVEVHLLICVCSVSADSLQCNFGKEGSRTFGFDEALLGVFVSQHSPFYAQETQHPTSCVFGPWRVVP